MASNLDNNEKESDEICVAVCRKLKQIILLIKFYFKNFFSDLLGYQVLVLSMSVLGALLLYFSEFDSYLVEMVSILHELYPAGWLFALIASSALILFVVRVFYRVLKVQLVHRQPSWFTFLIHTTILIVAVRYPFAHCYYYVWLKVKENPWNIVVVISFTLVVIVTYRLLRRVASRNDVKYSHKDFAYDPNIDYSKSLSVINVIDTRESLLEFHADYVLRKAIPQVSVLSVVGKQGDGKSLFARRLSEKIAENYKIKSESKIPPLLTYISLTETNKDEDFSALFSKRWRETLSRRYPLMNIDAKILNNLSNLVGNFAEQMGFVSSIVELFGDNSLIKVRLKSNDKEVDSDVAKAFAYIPCIIEECWVIIIDELDRSPITEIYRVIETLERFKELSKRVLPTKLVFLLCYDSERITKTIKDSQSDSGGINALCERFLLGGYKAGEQKIFLPPLTAQQKFEITKAILSSEKIDEDKTVFDLLYFDEYKEGGFNPGVYFKNGADLGLTQFFEINAASIRVVQNIALNTSFIAKYIYENNEKPLYPLLEGDSNLSQALPLFLLEYLSNNHPVIYHHIIFQHGKEYEYSRQEVENQSAVLSDEWFTMNGIQPIEGEEISLIRSIYSKYLNFRDPKSLDNRAGTPGSLLAEFNAYLRKDFSARDRIESQEYTIGINDARQLIADNLDNKNKSRTAIFNKLQNIDDSKLIITLEEFSRRYSDNTVGMLAAIDLASQRIKEISKKEVKVSKLSIRFAYMFAHFLIEAHKKGDDNIKTEIQNRLNSVLSDKEVQLVVRMILLSSMVGFDSSGTGRPDPDYTLGGINQLVSSSSSVINGMFIELDQGFFEELLWNQGEYEFMLNNSIIGDGNHDEKNEMIRKTLKDCLMKNKVPDSFIKRLLERFAEIKDFTDETQPQILVGINMNFVRYFNPVELLKELGLDKINKLLINNKKQQSIVFSYLESENSTAIYSQVQKIRERSNQGSLRQFLVARGIIQANSISEEVRR